MTTRTVEIRCIDGDFPDDLHGRGMAVIDVIRATTTAVTAVDCGLRCFPVSSVEEAQLVGGRLKRPILAGEVGGIRPEGFDLNNSPAAVARADRSRPLVLLSTGGTRLMREAGALDTVEIATLRNYRAVASRLIVRDREVALLARTTRGEFRDEDQMCAAWIAEILRSHGLTPLPDTADLIERWSGASVDDLEGTASVAYLSRSDQLEDWEFIRTHVDDLNDGFVLAAGEVTREP